VTDAGPQRRYSRGWQVATVAIGGLLAVLGAVLTCGGILPVLQSVRGELVIEECAAQRGPTRCWGTFTSDDGTVQRRVSVEVNDPRPDRVAGWIDGPDSDRLHNNLVSPVVPVLIGVLLLLVGPGLLLSNAFEERQARRAPGV